MLGIATLLVAAAVLALGTAVVFPFEMDTIVALSRERLVATHYGFYNTVCGVGILLGNLGTGWAVDLARSAGLAPAPWAVLLGVGLLSAAALVALNRRGLLSPGPADGQPADPEPAQERPVAVGAVPVHDDPTLWTVPLPVCPGWRTATDSEPPTEPLRIAPASKWSWFDRPPIPPADNRRGQVPRSV